MLVPFPEPVSSFVAGIKQSSRQGEFHPKPLTEPCLNVSAYTALPDLNANNHLGMCNLPVGEQVRTCFIHCL
jgi:hypothetical protein